MKNLIEQTLRKLIQNSFDISYIESISVEELFNLRTSSYEKNIIITHGRISYLDRIEKELSFDGVHVKQLYVGEISKNKRFSKSFWVKQTEKEKEELKKEHNPCYGCTVTCNVKECKIINTISGGGEMVDAQR